MRISVCHVVNCKWITHWWSIDTEQKWNPKTSHITPTETSSLQYCWNCAVEVYWSCFKKKVLAGKAWPDKQVYSFFWLCTLFFRCEELGRSLEVVGTSETDAICGDVLPRKSWVLTSACFACVSFFKISIFSFELVQCERWSYLSDSVSSCWSSAPVCHMTSLFGN